MNSESLGNEDSGKSEEVSLMIPLGIEDNAVQLEVMMNDDENSQTNSLLQGTTESASTSSCLLKSDCGQFYLVTYDKEDRVISKHHINLQCDGTEDFLGLGYVSNPPISINAVDSSMQDPVSIMANNQEEKLQAGEHNYLYCFWHDKRFSLLPCVNFNFCRRYPSACYARNWKWCQFARACLIWSQIGSNDCHATKEYHTRDDLWLPYLFQCAF